jgi:hypothetical protein
MQILRLHWRSMMPWDRSPDNHLTIAQRRDYLMACLSWLRDLLMVGFSVLLLIVTALLLTGSHFVLMPLGGNSPLLPMSLIIVATVCMTWTQRHWTSISWRRAGLALMISLSAAWITALACVQGLTRREGVFLRTKKKGADQRPIRTALRLTRVETLLSLSLYACFGLLLSRAHPPYILIVIIFLQASVFACAPIAALWNTRAQRVPGYKYRARYATRQIRRSRRLAPNFLTVGFIGALVLALFGGLAIAAFSAPSKLAPVHAVTDGGVGSVAPVSQSQIQPGH